MKKYLLVVFPCVVFSLMTSCEDYLDKAPEAGLTEGDVFTKYDNLFKFFEWVYREDRNEKEYTIGAYWEPSIGYLSLPVIAPSTS